MILKFGDRKDIFAKLETKSVYGTSNATNTNWKVDEVIKTFMASINISAVLNRQNHSNPIRVKILRIRI